MKKLITALFCSVIGGTTFAQWTPTSYNGKSEIVSNARSYYSLDINDIRAKLAGAQEMGANAKAVEISIPTMEGKVEKFSVYSLPVVVKSLADQYQLGSYVGVGIDDPSKLVRFSVAPNDFQSMIVKNGVYEFIEPMDSSKSVYGVHPKTTDVGSQGFLCSMDEDILSKQQIAQLYNSKKSFANDPSNFSKASDKKYRTLRLAMSVTGEYTAYFGGTVAGALTGINATLTRVNGVFEKDMALHLILQDFQNVIFINAATDPYSDASSMGNWNVQLQQTLTAYVGNENYDIGHLFGRSGGGGNAGCIGCICENPATANSKAKGSGFTSPANAIPMGDKFDIDYVAHEMGHQLGANHTFTHSLEGSGVNMEPGSGSTIMGYAGITNANVQMDSDPYFHVASLIQMQNNLISKTCDIETSVANNPPLISALPNYLIPKSTAFVLTGNATDPEGNQMTYTWEQFDDSQVTVLGIDGSFPSGPLFRSLLPSTSSTRYFPKLATVLSGALSSTIDWEAVSTVPRGTNFMFTVRDNHPTSSQQQTSSALQKIDVGNEGPFKVTSTNVYNNTAGAITWDVVGTNGNGYNVQNVKIDYTTNNGVTWTVISASTPNDGAESYNFSTVPTGSTVKIRVSAIGNVFYAIGSATVSALSNNCSSAAPTGLSVTGITKFSANVSWNAAQGATYSFRYRKVGTTTWSTVNVNTNSYYVSGLDEGSQYEYQVANICGSTTGTYSAVANFTTLLYTPCQNATASAADEYISNVSVTPSGVSTPISNTSAGSTYTSYVNDPTKLITLAQGSSNNTISVTKQWTGQTYAEGVAAWIDFNRDGNFTDSEKIISTTPSTTAVVNSSFSVPANAFAGQNLVMRVMLIYANQPTGACNAYAYGEVEDYPVYITGTNLGTSENVKESGIQIYPNPATDFLNVTKVSDKAAYKIYSAAGQLVGNGTISNGRINVSSLIKGAYVISIEDKGKETFNSKFIKK